MKKNLTRKIIDEVKKILFTELYFILVSGFLYVLVKPQLYYYKKNYEGERLKQKQFSLIEFSNKFFPQNKKLSKEKSPNKYDIREYRDKYDRQGLELYFKLLDSETLFTNKEIMDLGTGVGGKAIEILKYNPKHFLGIDLSQRNIKYAQELVDDERLQFKAIDLFDLDQKFETIVSFTVFEHIDEEILLPILNKLSELITDDGNIMIVFNHFNDIFGTHTLEYIYHPWPQSLFSEELIYSYWNTRLTNDPNITEDSYFPPEYKHGTDGHNSDCLMNLNQVSIEEFREIIKKSNLNIANEYNYSKFRIVKLLPFIRNKYLEGSVLYQLKGKAS